MNVRFSAFVFCIAFVSARAADIPEVELINDAGDQLQPSSTLEIRFARPMIDREHLTGAAVESPLIFKPGLPGQFTWLSRQSGVFVPDEAPPLGVTYTVTVRPDLKAADAKPIGRKFRATLHTPEFGPTDNRSGAPDQETNPNPSLRLVFNAELPAEAKYFSFVGDHGERIPARVRYLTSDDPTGPPREEQDWEKRWRAARAAPQPLASPGTATETFFNCLIVSPESALGTGHTWQLEVAQGFPSRSGQYQLSAARTVPLGTVKPFTVTGLRTESHINSGRSVTLEFSEPLAPDVNDEENGAKFFHIDPPVANLKLEEGYKQVTLRGAFTRGQTYRIEIDASVIAENGLPLEGERTRSFQFEPVKPRIYLPEIDGAQILSGQRKIPIETVNLKTVHVRARLLAPEQVAPAIEAFAKYSEMPSEDTEPDEWFSRVPEDAIASASLIEQTIELPAGELDRKQTCAIEWDKIVGPQKPAAVFLTVEGEPRPEIGGRKPGGQALVQVTDLGILWKKTAEELRVNVFSHATGGPVADARVGLLSDTFEPIYNGKTDSAGFVAISLGKVPAWLVVQRDADVHALRMGERAAQIWMGGYGVPVGYRDWKDNGPSKTSLRACVFTDQPLYQPNDEVHVKGIVREVAENGLRMAANRSGTLDLSDERGQRIAQKEIRTDERGSFDITLPLESISTGAKTLTLKFSDEVSLMYEESSARFQVAAYQPNAFELKVSAPPRLAPGETLRAGVTGKYFFGGALTQAQVRWTLRYFTDPFRPDGFDDFIFGRDGDEETAKPLTVRGEGALGNEYVIAPQLPAASGTPKKSVLTVEVTDANQQTVSETQRVVHDASQFYLGIAPLSHDVVGVGDDVPVRAVAVQADGQPLAQAMKISVELFHLHFQTTRVQGAGKAISFKTERTEEKIGGNSGETVLPRKTGEFWQAPEEGGIIFKAPKPGQYCVRVTAKDASGHEATSERDFYVSGDAASLAWDYANTAQVTLVPDKEEYQAGDKARILVKTPIAGEARISIERGEKILREQRVRLEGNAPSFEVPIEAGDAPNVFVSFVIIRGAEASTRKFKIPESRYGACVLRVVKPETRLQVKVTPARPEVQPGAEVETEIIVRDGRGAPAADAEVTFFAVDDGVLALTGYARPAPGKIFESPVPLLIRTGLTLRDLLPEDPAALTFDNKGYLIGGGGTEGPGAKLRRNFPGTACWMPSLRTDRDGKIRVHFTAPGALTRYRLVAVANAGNDMFGSAESSFVIRKPLMILSALGQFANTGDDLIARAVVRNETGADIRAAVTLQLDATAESSRPTSANVEIKNGEGRTVEFPIKLRRTGKAEWKWKASAEANGAQFADEMAVTLEVGSPMLQLREIYFADARAARTNLLKGVNPQVLDGSGNLVLTVANTRLASLRESANHLREYPYGCAEQTTSSLIPWIVLPKLKPVLPDLKTGEESAAISKGLDKLKSMQTSNGGIAFWPGGQRPQLFVSAYAAMALAMLPSSESGPDRTKLLNFLSNELRGSSAIHDETKLHDRVLALYALALSHRPEPSYHEEFFRRHAELSHEARALLALAILESKGPSAMVRELLDKRKPAPEHFSWYSGAAREAATELFAWSQFDSKSSEIAPVTNELLRYRRNGRCDTTQENAWALLALARYYELVEHGGGPAQGEIVFDRSTKPFDLSESKPAQNESFEIEGKTSAPSLIINNPQKSALYADTDFKVYPPLGEQPRQDRGFAVSRGYRKIGNDGALLEPRDLKVGDRILVSLRVEISRPARFVAIDDPLPAIFEAVNPAFITRATGEEAEFETESFSDYREMRADRVLIFCDSMPAGAHTYHYLARVRSAGTAAAGATKAEEMYRPERFGLSELVHVSSQLAESR